ncbi:hypothetical protein GDO78_020972 [Eleutherodactylus coqui]|uniref:Uncharacterized protein n=1 Tax=Eleutherodactylus coqui TaxID=57060 RepID=A0A8J6BDQ3_ELECQ|nr:hypothetical protein GDO78_020972 [Eleutherodactylus coqui]
MGSPSPLDLLRFEDFQAPRILLKRTARWACLSLEWTESYCPLLLPQTGCRWAAMWCCNCCCRYTQRPPPPQKSLDSSQLSPLKPSSPENWNLFPLLVILRLAFPHRRELHNFPSARAQWAWPFCLLPDPC